MMERKCGDCQLCCKLVPVASLAKKANKKCQFQKFHKGCTVYHTDKMPIECQLWNCMWIINKDTTDLLRPDKTHYVIDCFPDSFSIHDDISNKTINIMAVQIWCDPDYPDAWKDPKLIEFMERRGLQNIAIMIRYNSYDSTIIIPAAMSPTGKMIAIDNKANSIDENTIARDTAMREQYIRKHGLEKDTKPLEHIEGLSDHIKDLSRHIERINKGG